MATAEEQVVAAQAEGVKARREYVVLRHHANVESGSEWRMVGPDDGYWLGATDTDAIDNAITACELPENGTYSAVPARYWHPRTGVVETVKKRSWT